MANSKQRHDDEELESEEEFEDEDYDDEDEEESESEESESADVEEKPRKKSRRPHGRSKSTSSAKRRKDGSESRARRGSRELTAQEAAGEAMKQIAGLTCHCALGATAIQPMENGWSVEVEVLEERRIPSTADLLSLYAVELDKKGQLVSYHRIKRYSRNRTDGSGGC